MKEVGRKSAVRLAAKAFEADPCEQVARSD